VSLNGEGLASVKPITRACVLRRNDGSGEGLSLFLRGRLSPAPRLGFRLSHPCNAVLVLNRVVLIAGDFNLAIVSPLGRPSNLNLRPRTPVSPKMNSPRYNEPDCIEALVA
jgi:hypothetical protein